jgi:hypothetical protein
MSAAFANTELVYVVLATLVGLAFVSCYRKENPNKVRRLSIDYVEARYILSSNPEVA